MEGKAKVAHHGFTHTNIEHHADGSHTVHHLHSDGDHKHVKHAAMNLDHVHDSLQDHLGAPNHGEGQGADNEAMEEKLAPGIHSAIAAMPPGGPVGPQGA